MDIITGLIKIMTDFGTGALFLSLYLITIYYYRAEIKEHTAKAETRAEQVTTALNKASAAMEAQVTAQNEAKAIIEQLSRDVANFISRQNGREERRMDQR